MSFTWRVLSPLFTRPRILELRVYPRSYDLDYVRNWLADRFFVLAKSLCSSHRLSSLYLRAIRFRRFYRQHVYVSCRPYLRVRIHCLRGHCGHIPFDVCLRSLLGDRVDHYGLLTEFRLHSLAS